MSASAAFARRSVVRTPWISRGYAALSSTVRWGSSAKCWKTMLRRARRSARSSFASTAGDVGVRRSGRARRSDSSRPLSIRMSVDLPEPDRPMTTKISPGTDLEARVDHRGGPVRFDLVAAGACVESAKGLGGTAAEDLGDVLDAQGDGGFADVGPGRSWTRHEPGIGSRICSVGRHDGRVRHLSVDRCARHVGGRRERRGGAASLSARDFGIVVDALTGSRWRRARRAVVRRASASCLVKVTEGNGRGVWWALLAVCNARGPSLSRGVWRFCFVISS